MHKNKITFNYAVTMVVLFIALYCIHGATSRVLNISNESTPKPRETRRITNGRVVQGEKRFMVYLLKAKEDPNKSASWLCGGAIISHQYIVTSAACVHAVELIYVINGYNKYVNQDLAENDECITKKRKRIIHSCFSKQFIVNYMYNYLYYWNYGDIAVSRVDDPFDFNDMSYYQYCSYPPGPIRVKTNFNGLEEHEVITYGWGSRKYYRPFNMTLDLNEERLRYSNGRTMSIETCYNNHLSWKTSHLKHHAKRFFICVTKKGSLDEYGHIEDTDFSVMKGCEAGDVQRRNANDTEYQKCLEEQALRTRLTDNSFLLLGGFCQNDHGGPLVSYFGGHETLVGVSTLFWVSMNMECRGPYMYTNLKCISKKIVCLLDPYSHFYLRPKSRRGPTTICDGITENEGLTEKNFTWPDNM